jgi:hypothetical protein
MKWEKERGKRNWREGKEAVSVILPLYIIRLMFLHRYYYCYMDFALHKYFPLYNKAREYATTLV